MTHPAPDRQMTTMSEAQVLEVFHNWRRLLPPGTFTHGQGLLFTCMLTDAFAVHALAESRPARDEAP